MNAVKMYLHALIFIQVLYTYPNMLLFRGAEDAVIWNHMLIIITLLVIKYNKMLWFFLFPIQFCFGMLVFWCLDWFNHWLN